jgi:hypothetical protein
MKTQYGWPVAGLLLSLVLTAKVTADDIDSETWADYKSWNLIHNKPITGDHTGFLGSLHRGAEGVRRVYVNDIALPVSQGNAPYEYPIGSIIVKEQYKNMKRFDDGKKPDLTVMVKVSDNAANPAENWAWSRGSKKTAKTDDAFCSGCHTIAASNDYVFSNAETLKAFQ